MLNVLCNRKGHFDLGPKNLAIFELGLILFDFLLHMFVVRSHIVQGCGSCKPYMYILIFT